MCGMLLVLSDHTYEPIFMKFEPFEATRQARHILMPILHYLRYWNFLNGFDEEI